MQPLADTAPIAIPWTVKLARRTHPFFFPVIWVVCSLGYFFVVFNYSEGESWAWETRALAVGTSLVYCLIPGYLWCCSFYQWNLTTKALNDLAGLLESPEDWTRRVQNPSFSFLLGWAVAIGLYGMSQNFMLIQNMDRSANPWLDTSMVVANIIMFASIGSFLGRRIYAHTGLFQAGYLVKVDLYNLQTLSPFANIALRDVLVVMGALAFMPLQSLDAEFRWENYEAGFVIGAVSIIAFVVLPMWGVHRSIQHQQSNRLEEIQTEMNAIDRKDIANLEKILAHKDRIQSMNTWPLDIRLISRVAFYLVIPPLAWIGAALVENFVENFIN